ncbi:MAG: hypothetical protein JWR51_1219 [Devosia sp.]|uniref:hypothetical protein n=1 Tax=Devosia sp. TaxID=1871048 RepID=UPI002630E3CA|nr:hypothetical protein [Devosia sp.]MDB5528116.1 hypothetical protein [Devosia sp.]
MKSQWNALIAFCLIGTAVMLASVVTVSASPPFAPVDASFSGTSFRGVALGQSRAEVEAALAANGMRCYSPEEIAQGGSVPIENVTGEYSTCRIGADEELTPFNLQILMNLRLNVDLGNGKPTYAVSFINDVASELALSPLFFNADTMAPSDFAQSIVDNYPLPDGLGAGTDGWVGHTANGEVVTLRVDSRHGVTVFVERATAGNTPTFN